MSRTAGASIFLPQRRWVQTCSRPLLLESIPHRRRTMGRLQMARDPAAVVPMNAAGGVSTDLAIPPVRLMVA